MKLHAERVRINRDGYDNRGKYWGDPSSPLYNVSNDEPPYIDAYVRAPNAATARRKVEIQKGLRHETAKEKGYHPLYDRSERLRRGINAASPYGHMPSIAEARTWLRQADRLAALVKAKNPGDIAWRYADAELQRAREALKSRYADRPQAAAAKTYIRQALESVSGAASRAGKAERDPAKQAYRVYAVSPKTGREYLFATHYGHTKAQLREVVERMKRHYQGVRVEEAASPNRDPRRRAAAGKSRRTRG